MFPCPLLLRRRHPVRLHSVAATRSTPSPPSARPSPPHPGTTLSRSSSTVTVLLLLPHRRRCPAPYLSSTPHPGPSHHLPDRLHRRRYRTQKPHRLPDCHRLRVHTTRAVLLAVTTAAVDSIHLLKPFSNQPCLVPFYGAISSSFNFIDLL
jgi:hypothetical protein